VTKLVLPEHSTITSGGQIIEGNKFGNTAKGGGALFLKSKSFHRKMNAVQYGMKGSLPDNHLKRGLFRRGGEKVNLTTEKFRARGNRVAPPPKEKRRPRREIWPGCNRTSIPGSPHINSRGGGRLNRRLSKNSSTVMIGPTKGRKERSFMCFSNENVNAENPN